MQQNPSDLTEEATETTLKAHLAQSANGAALAKYNEELQELNRLAEGEDPFEED